MLQPLIPLQAPTLTKKPALGGLEAVKTLRVRREAQERLN